MARVGRERDIAITPVSAAALLWETLHALGDTCAAVSISGATARTVEAAARARAGGARVIAVR